MNTLKTLSAKHFKIAFTNGLSLCGVEEGRPLWLGDKTQFSNFNRELEANNL